MSVPIRLGKTEIGTMFLLSLVFLAAVLAVLGVIFQDNWAKGGVGAAIIHRNPALLEHNQREKDAYAVGPQATGTSHPLNQPSSEF